MVKLVKDTDGFISRHINRKISTRISVFLVKSRFSVSPNEMTVLSFLTAVLSACLFLWNFPFFGGVMAQISSILDGCDGEIARLTNRTSKDGEILDAVLDRFADGLIIMAMTILAYNTAPLVIERSLIIALGFLALMGSFNISYSAAKGANVGYKYKRRWAGRDVRLFTVMIAGMVAVIVPASLFLFLLVITVLTFSEVAVRIKETFSRTLNSS